jgi:hypothetical protein
MIDPANHNYAGAAVREKNLLGREDETGIPLTVSSDVRYNLY